MWRVSAVAGRCSVTQSASATASSTRLGQLGAALAHAVGADERVVRDDAHAEPAGAGRDELPDAAEADHRERLVGQLDATEAAALPAPVDQRRVRLRDVARQRQHQRDRVLRRRQRVRLRRVADQDAARRGRLDVDVVDTGAGPADHAQPRAGGDQLGVDARGGAHHERVVAGDPLQQLGAVEVRRDVDLGRLAQPVDAGRGDGLGDEDLHAAWAREKAPTPAPSSIGVRPRAARPRAPRGRARCRPPRSRRTSRCAGCGPRARPGRRRR